MSEKKVLKVGSPQGQSQDMGGVPPMPMGEQPAADGQMPMDQPPMEQPPMGGGDEGQMGMEGNPYDTNFDAGVDANEEEDPKRYIQQLTGKLSQSLRSYNEQQPQPDADLNKYVAGMIVKQATEGLTKADIDEIIGKLNEPSDGQQSTDDGTGDDPNATPDGGEQEMEQPQQQPPMPTESLDRHEQGRKISEIFQELTSPEDSKTMGDGLQPKKGKGYRAKPLSAPQFA